jgi:hypothetical protein
LHSPTSIKASMEGGNEQSKRICHLLANASLEHAAHVRETCAFREHGPNIEAASVVHWLYLICEPRFIVVYDEQKLGERGSGWQPASTCSCLPLGSLPVQTDTRKNDVRRC